MSQAERDQVEMQLFMEGLEKEFDHMFLGCALALSRLPGNISALCTIDPYMAAALKEDTVGMLSTVCAFAGWEPEDVTALANRIVAKVDEIISREN